MKQTNPSPDARDVLELLTRYAEAPRRQRDDLPGSRNRWPACGKMTKGDPVRGRKPAPCRATGGGFGGRCERHGGLNPGSLVGMARNEPGRARKLVLFDVLINPLEAVQPARRDLRRWEFWTLPLDVYERLSPVLFVFGAEPGRIADAIGGATRWPQRLSFRAVLKLLERGRVAFGLFYAQRSVLRATRRKVAGDEATIRVGPKTLLKSLYAIGATPQPLPIPRDVWLSMRRTPTGRAPQAAAIGAQRQV